MSEWIKCADRLPEDEQYILAYGYGGCHVYGPSEYINDIKKHLQIELCRYTNSKFIYGEYSCKLKATHWMPLPKPPEGV